MAIDLGGAAAAKKKKETAAERNARLQAAFNLKQAAAVSSEPTVTSRRDEALSEPATAYPTPSQQTVLNQLPVQYGQYRTTPPFVREQTRAALEAERAGLGTALTQPVRPGEGGVFLSPGEGLPQEDVSGKAQDLLGDFFGATIIGPSGGGLGVESAGLSTIDPASILTSTNAEGSPMGTLNVVPGTVPGTPGPESPQAGLILGGGGRELADVHGTWADAFKDAPYQEAIRRLIQQKMWDEWNLSNYYDTLDLGDAFALDDEYDGGGGGGGGGGGVNPNDPYWWMNLVKWNI